LLNEWEQKLRRWRGWNQAEDVIVIHLHWEHYAAMRKRSTVIWWFDWFLVTLETAVSFQPSAVSYKYKTS
jgi:hypothetical protein